MRNRKLFAIFSILCAFTLLIVLSSVIFSVQHIYENCTKGELPVALEGEMTLGERVLSSHGIKKGRSIFLVDKDEVKNNLESAVPSINVVSIEKKFPNRIYINYEVLFDYFQVHSGGRFYILSKGNKITRVVDSRLDDDKIVHVYLGGELNEHKAGQKLTSARAGELDALSSILSALERLGQEYYEITQMFEFVDLTNEHEVVFLKTSTGVYFRMMDWTSIDLKMQALLSVYGQKDKDTDVYKYRTEGTITVSNSLMATYTEEVLYESR